MAAQYLSSVVDSNVGSAAGLEENYSGRSLLALSVRHLYGCFGGQPGGHFAFVGVSVPVQYL